MSQSTRGGYNYGTMNLMRMKFRDSKLLESQHFVGYPTSIVMSQSEDFNFKFAGF